MTKQEVKSFRGDFQKAVAQLEAQYGVRISLGTIRFDVNGLSAKMKATGVNVWLVNTGWTGGPYGIGTRMKLAYTRAMVNAAMDGSLEAANKDNYHIHSVFGVLQPRVCPNVPTEFLSPRKTWKNDEGFYKTAHKLANSFKTNFKKFESYANQEIMDGGPNI